MNNSINKSLNENYNKDELYGTNLMLVYCVYHGVCYLRKCSKTECEKYEVPLKYKAPHSKHLGVCDETDLYNMGSFNFYENKETNIIDILVIQKIRIDYTKFANGTEFSDFYNKDTDTITDECGNEIHYKNNNLIEWFEYIQSNKADFGDFLNEGESFFNY